MNSEELADLFDGVPEINLTDCQKKSYEKAAKLFNSYIRSDEETLFSQIASGKRKSLFQLLKLTIPGEEACSDVEQMRQAFFKGEPREKIVGLYYSSLELTSKYLLPENNLDAQCTFDVLIVFYEAYARKCLNVDDILYQSVKNREVSSYRPFFEQYLSQFREKMKDIMNLPGLGAMRNKNAAYRRVICTYIELFLTYTVFFIYNYELASESFDLFVQRITDEVMNSRERFYQLWLEVNNEVIAAAYAGEKFSDYLIDFQNTYNRFIIDSKAYCEINLADVPVAKESDMRALYKTVYDLQKEVAELKKELKEIKGC